MSKELEDALVQLVCLASGVFAGWMMGSHSEVLKRLRDNARRLDVLCEDLQRAIGSQKGREGGE